MKKIYFILFIFIFSVNSYANDFIIIKDMRNKEIKIPKNIERIATIDDGFIEGVLTHLGEIDKVISIGSWSMKRDYKYDFITTKGEKYSVNGLNTMKFLHPWLNDLPCVNSSQGNIINYETLAKSNPQLVILRVGDCTVRGINKEVLDKTINTIESLKIPLIVLFSPSYYGNNGLSTMKDEARIIGEIFNKKDKAIDLYNYLYGIEEFIISRTKNIKNKVKVLYIGLSPVAREKGGSGNVFGVNTPESFIIEEIVNGKNAYQSKGANVIISAEQIYSLDPDVIILPTLNGYHPAKELLESPDFTILNELKAIKNKQVYSLAWSPMNCSRRVEYPIDMMIIAKATYPNLFKDIKVHQFVLDFYKKVYGVDDKKAKELRSTQILDWTVENDF